MVRRPQKPFAVEVKRGRKAAAPGTPAIAPKFPEKSPEPVAVAAVVSRPAALPPAPSAPKPQRRILEALEPAPVPFSAADPVVASSPVTRSSPANTSSPVVETFKPRRGRPPKVARESDTAGERAIVVEQRPEAVVYTYVRREVALVTQSDAFFVAPPPHKPKKSASVSGHVIHAGHVTHADRVEAAVALPRGERWKRRLPKVLW